MSRASAWMFYLLGAFLTLGWKLARYVRVEKKKGIPVHDAVAQWFFEDSIENTTSWLTTISLVWCLGAVYVDLRENAGIFSFMQAIPMHYAIAFALGGIMELAAPSLAKNLVGWIISKMPGGQP